MQSVGGNSAHISLGITCTIAASFKHALNYSTAISLICAPNNMNHRMEVLCKIDAWFARLLILQYNSITTKHIIHWFDFYLLTASWSQICLPVSSLSNVFDLSRWTVSLISRMFEFEAKCGLNCCCFELDPKSPLPFWVIIVGFQVSTSPDVSFIPSSSSHTTLT